ncbi:hypothetical protein [Mitsuaria sp. GD03876]|uniref:hypothetical protein n=1 Tax=Mitsuaria sp. GD03876 TaxID=2975399 RepID=UPI00244B17E9|nr:hypothetical protein [Mitsuaria sp. GD03876]MDH0865769.1 hypothetical protein [Mitsuaria sp. GD03876]
MTDPQGVPVDDPAMTRWNDALRARDRLHEAMGLQGDRHGAVKPASDTPAAPYDLEPEAPRALSLAKLLQLSGAPMPPEIQATVGEHEALIVLHGLTPFHAEGARPQEIWGMGYSAVPKDCDAARTVSFEPSDRVIKAIEVNQTLAIDLDVHGRMVAGVPEAGAGPALPLAAGLAGGASTRQGFALSLQLEWSAVEVQAGPVGSGGVRWNLYRQGRRIDRYHRLMHTLLVPRGTRTLTFEVDTWVRRQGLFGGLLGTRHWQSPRREFTLNVETVPA